jgi:hypothetical protein
LSAIHDWPVNVRAIAIYFHSIAILMSGQIQNHSHLMPAFNPNKIRKAVEEFTPRRPEKFQELIAAKDVIIELRRKRASYRSIADLLSRHCLPTCKTSVGLFCHKILGETVRPYRRPIHQQPPAAEVPVREEASPAISPPAGASPPADTNDNETPQPRVRGPRIAQVRMLKPQPQTP